MIGQKFGRSRRDVKTPKSTKESYQLTAARCLALPVQRSLDIVLSCWILRGSCGCASAQVQSAGERDREAEIAAVSLPHLRAERVH